MLIACIEHIIPIDKHRPSDIMPPKKAALEQIANARKEVEQVKISFHCPHLKGSIMMKLLIVEEGARRTEETYVRDPG